ncbi:MAG: hypothetical protein PW786_10280 [Arachidicoccus sp.]|nr:hypothetical protein [Arachidicoccus sp.]
MPGALIGAGAGYFGGLAYTVFSGRDQFKDVLIGTLAGAVIGGFAGDIGNINFGSGIGSNGLSAMNSKVASFTSLGVKAADITLALVATKSPASYLTPTVLSGGPGVAVTMVKPYTPPSISSATNNNVSFASNDDERGITPSIRKVLDYIYDKEGRAYEDTHSKPPTDQPTKFGIDFDIFDDNAENALGLTPSVTNLKHLTQVQADKFYMNVYILPFGYEKLTNFPILNALLSQAPLGQYGVQVNAKKALNKVLGGGFDVNTKAFTNSQARAINGLGNNTVQYINTFGGLQYNYYMGKYDKNPIRNKQYINGWINRLNELINPKYNLPVKKNK